MFLSPIKTFQITLRFGWFGANSRTNFVWSVLVPWLQQYPTFECSRAQNSYLFSSKMVLLLLIDGESLRLVRNFFHLFCSNAYLSTRFRISYFSKNVAHDNLHHTSELLSDSILWPGTKLYQYSVKLFVNGIELKFGCPWKTERP